MSLDVEMDFLYLLMKTQLSDFFDDNSDFIRYK